MHASVQAQLHGNPSDKARDTASHTQLLTHAALAVGCTLLSTTSLEPEWRTRSVLCRQYRSILCGHDSAGKRVAFSSKFSLRDARAAGDNGTTEDQQRIRSTGGLSRRSGFL
jgi:hypothetical protein